MVSNEVERGIETLERFISEGTCVQAHILSKGGWGKRHVLFAERGEDPLFCAGKAPNHCLFVVFDKSSDGFLEIDFERVICFEVPSDVAFLLALPHATIMFSRSVIVRGI